MRAADVPREPARGGGRRAAAFWILAVAVYVALGAWQPAVFFLGFWQALIYVALVTWVAGRLQRGRA